MADLLTDCIVWRGPLNRYGYGVSKVRGNRMTAHRRAWASANGPIPNGLMVLHRCNNRACVNPAHLYVGTAKDNSHDAVRAGTLRPPFRGVTHCKRGHAFTRENTYVWHGKRHCLACKSLRRAGAI